MAGRNLTWAEKVVQGGRRLRFVCWSDRLRRFKNRANHSVWEEIQRSTLSNFGYGFFGDSVVMVLIF